MLKIKKNYMANPMKVIAFIFIGIILLGTLLLMLPISNRDGTWCDFLSALFTATSATCVTGLVMFDTYTQWSGFGQFVIITMIEIGGLGFISAFSMLLFALKKKISFKQKLVMAQSFNVSDMSEVVDMQKWVIKSSLFIQALGALILTMVFTREYDLWLSLKLGLFHSISAFCNAGFDILGFVEPGASLVHFNDNPYLLLTLSALIISGGLGFFVWKEVVDYRKTKKLSLYSKMVLAINAVLLSVGTLMFLVMEWNNQGTLGNMSTLNKVVNAFFQSVTLRTAGFDAIGQLGLTEASKAISIPLMLIGGSSGSTAGGMKTVSALVVAMFFLSRMQNKNHVSIERKEITTDQMMDALTLLSVMAFLMFFGAVFITITSPIALIDALFETTSALATVGVTTGVTTLLSVPAKIMIIIFMYFGRIGILTLSMGFLFRSKKEDHVKYSKAKLLIG